MDFALPEIGEGVYEAELIAWLVKPGDVVKRGQNLMEVMTDKATMEVPAPFAGTITALRAEPGQKIKVGEVVLTYAGAEQPAAAVPAEAAATAAAPPVHANGPRGAGGEPPAGQGGAVGAADGPQARRRSRPPSTAAAPAAASSSRIWPPASRRRPRSDADRPAAAAAGLRQARHAHQAPGAAPQDRRAHGPRQAHHPALQLRR